MPDTVRSILVFRLRSIGDTVLLTPALDALTQHWPEAKLTLVVERPIDEIMHKLNGVHEVIALAPKGLRAWQSRVRCGLSTRGRYDLALDFHGGTTAAMLTWLSKARVRVGLEAYRNSFAYTHKLPSQHKGVERSITLHTTESNLEFVRQLGVKTHAAAKPRVGLSNEDLAEADKLLSSFGLSKTQPFVLLNPGATMASKCWPFENFVEVGKSLVERGMSVVAGFRPGEQLLASRFAELSGAKTVVDVRLGVYAACIRRSQLLITNDSGPAHLAAAQDVATVTIFGSQSPDVWKPVGDIHTVMWAGLECSPCRGQSCSNPDSLACLTQIKPEAVIQAALQALEAHCG